MISGRLLRWRGLLGPSSNTIQNRTRFSRAEQDRCTADRPERPAGHPVAVESRSKHLPPEAATTAGASCTGVCAVGNSPVTAGGAVRLPIETPTPTTAFDPSGVPRALTTPNKLAADSPKVICGNACLDLLPSPGSY